MIVLEEEEGNKLDNDFEFDVVRNISRFFNNLFFKGKLI